MKHLSLLPLLFGLLVACSPATTDVPTALDSPTAAVTTQSSVDPREDPRCRKALTESSRYEIVWMPVGAEVPKNRYFELKLWIFRGDEPVRDARVQVTAEMPEHAHGMNVQPGTRAQKDGSYSTKGMLLHMAGYWELYIDVIEAGRTERAAFRIDLP